MKTKTLFLGLIPLALAPALAAAEVKQPQEIIDRPRTTPGGQITVGADILHIRLGDFGDATGAQVGGLYGVNDKLEVGAAYGFGIDPEFEAKGDLDVTAAYSVLADDKLTVAADVGLGYSVLAEGLQPISVGAEVQFKVNDKIAVFTPGHQISIGIDEKTGKGMSIGVPVGVGLQATPQIFAHVSTNVAYIALNDDAGETAVFGADFVPLNIGAYFSPSNTMDFGATLGFLDIKEDASFLSILAGARLHM